MDTKQSSPQVTDSALRIPGDFPELPTDTLERFPSLGTWMSEVRRFWQRNENAMQDFARSVLDVTEVAGVLIVDGNAGSLYIKSGRGAGAYSDPDTPFYVDRAGYFSLKNKLTWNPVENVLTIEGTIIADAGEIGGFEIGTDYIRDQANSMGLASTVTGGDDVRFWAGDTFANRATAPFRVLESGALVATNATITGSITATSGSIGGFNIGADYIRDAANSMGLASTVTGGDDVRFWAGAAFAGRATAPFRVTEAGALVATNATITGDITATSGTIGGWSIGATTLTGGSVTLSSTGVITAGTGNDVVITSAADATYRLWIGNATAASAPFRVTKAGAMTASNATITGDITATSGTIAGFSITAGGFSAGTGATTVLLNNDTAVGLVFGDPASLHLRLRSLSTTVCGLECYNTSNIAVANLLTTTYGSLTLLTAAGVTTVSLDGSSGNATFNGTVSGTHSGNGASLTSLNATNIASGTLDNARLPASISVTNVTASSALAGNTLTINGTQIINSSREVRSVGVIFSDNDANKCNFAYQAHVGADVAFTAYMKIFANGVATYVPCTTSAP